MEVMSMCMFRLMRRAPLSDMPRQFTKLSCTKAVAGTVLTVLSKFFTLTVVRSILNTSPSTPYFEKDPIAHFDKVVHVNLEVG